MAVPCTAMTASGWPARLFPIHSVPSVMAVHDMTRGGEPRRDSNALAPGDLHMSLGQNAADPMLARGGSRSSRAAGRGAPALERPRRAKPAAEHMRARQPRAGLAVRFDDEQLIHEVQRQGAMMTSFDIRNDRFFIRNILAL